METIVETKYYEIYYDKQKNRVYVNALGYWSAEAGEQYVAEWTKVGEYVQPYFTILIDVRNFATQSQAVQKSIEKAQERMMDIGVFKTANIVPKNIITRFQLDTMQKKTRLPKARFTSVEEAEQWLDESVARL